MSNDTKLTLQDLIDLLAEKQGITKKDADTFLRELLNLITETIEEKDFVRIKKFGTFKLTPIKARKSIDVNTNEAIEIPAHYRLNFIPDKELREGVNRPFAHYESVLVEDDSPLNQEEDNEAEEIADNHKTENNLHTQNPVLIDEIEQEGETPKTPRSETEEKKEEVVVEEIIRDYTERVEDKILVEEASSKIKENDLSEEIIEEEEEIKKRKFTPLLLICLLILIGIGGYWWYSAQKQPATTLVATETSEEQKTDNTDNNKNIILKDDSIPEIKSDDLADAGKIIEEEAKYIETEIQYNDTMRKLGLKYFGHRSFWVYIYEENKEVIKNPNAVPIGTKLRIPPASKYDIDAQDTESIKKAAALEEQLFKKFEK